MKDALDVAISTVIGLSLDAIGLIITCIGFCVSIIALARASHAKKAVRKFVKSQNEQLDRDRLNGLIAKLIDAKAASAARRASAQGFLKQGRTKSRDIFLIQEVDDILRTTLPFSFDTNLVD